MIALAFSLLAVPVSYAFAEWRLGLLLSLATAILQDPLRKLTPDQPVFFVGFAAVVFAAACLGAWSRGVSLGPGSIFGRNRGILIPMGLVLLLIVLQAVNSFSRFGNPMLPFLGLLTYLLPLPSIVFAYQLVCRGGEAHIFKFIKGYLLCMMLALPTVYLEYAGLAWPAFGQVGGMLEIYDARLQEIIYSYSGIFRASEIAAWHAATGACFIMLLVTLRKANFQTLLTAGILVAILMAIGILTGRRKGIVEVAVFASTCFILWLVFQKGVAKLGIALAIAGVVGFGWLVNQLGSDPPDYIDQGSRNYSSYVSRSKSVFEDAPSRFVELGIAPVTWAYDSFGLFGAGLGVGTQGTQHFGGGGDLAGAAEGGLGKITVELGIPGLFLMGWLAIVVTHHLWRIMGYASRISPRIARLSIGLFGFLVANVAAFSVSTQAFADLFILLILSWTLGFLLAVPVLLEREAQARELKTFQKLGPLSRRTFV